jgi:hypothetical protein
MNEIERGKENFQKALLEVCKNYLENLELAPEEDVSFLPGLERKMNRLLKAQRKPYWKFINTPYKRAVAACLALFLLLGTLVSCSFIREPIVTFFTNVYEKFTEFFFGDEDTETTSKVIEEIHTLTYVPEGYELVKSPVLTGKDNKLYTIWQNNDGAEIVFYQKVLTFKTTIDTENVEVKNLGNNIKITIIEKTKYTYVFWNDDNYAYVIITSDLSEESIEKMINSLI